jgi:hypothetical protein
MNLFHCLLLLLPWTLAIPSAAMFQLVLSAEPQKPKKQSNLTLEEEAERCPWEGIYAGFGKDGNDLYVATVTVKRHKGEHFVIWAVFTDKGHYSYTGAALKQGDTLSVGWKFGEQYGVHVMKKTADGAVGTWNALPGKGQRQPESWRFVSRLPNISEH